MELFPGEEFLVQSNDDRLQLTNQRISVYSKDWGASYRNTIFLEDISSIEVKYTSLFLALVVGILFIVAGFAMMDDSRGLAQPYSIGFGVVLIGVYFVSRKHVLSITPNGGKPINVGIGSMKEYDVEDFSFKVQLAKFALRSER